MIQGNGTLEKSLESDGLGINNMKTRAKKIGAKLEIIYENGFIVELTLN